MKRYITVLSIALAGIALFAAGGLARQATLDLDSDETVSAIELPSACDNFLEASALFAQHGASAAHGDDPSGVFAPDAETRAYDTLRGLLVSCDSELAKRSSDAGS
jgi:hypothetical protein